MQKNIVLILLDCCRADHLSCYGYKKNKTPNIDKIAEEGILFTDVIPQAPWTLPSHASLFTGLYPTEHGLLSASGEKIPKLNQKVKTLASILSNNGYATASISENPWLGSSSGLNRGFDLYIGDNLDVTGKPRMVNKFKENNIFKKIKRFIYRPRIPFFYRTNYTFKLIKKFISCNDNQPFFVFCNSKAAHQPYYPPKKYLKNKVKMSLTELNKEYGKFRSGEKYLDDRVTNDLRNQFVTVYDASLSFVDQKIGELIKFLKENKLYEETIFIITSDHGRALGKYTRDEELNFPMNEEHMKIPLIVKGLGGSNSVEKPVELRDVFSMILEKITGQINVNNSQVPPLSFNQLSKNRSQFSEYIFPHEKQSQTLVDRKGKTRFWYIKNNDYVYYETKKTRNLVKYPESHGGKFKKLKKREIKEKMRKELNEWKKCVEKYNQKAEEKEEMNEIIKKRLESLGYL